MTSVVDDVQDENDPRVGNNSFTCVSETVEGECSDVAYFIRLGSNSESSILARNTPSRMFLYHQPLMYCTKNC